MFNYNFTSTNQNLNSKQEDIFMNIYDDYLLKKSKKPAITSGTIRQSKIMRNRFYKFLFMQEKQNIRISEVTEELLNEYFVELKNGTKETSSYHRNIYYELISVFEYAVNLQLCKTNPVALISIHTPHPKELLYLNVEQMNYLTYVKVNPYMRTILDLFILQCYTGFSYVDLMNFNARIHYVKEHNGKDKILINRQKTKVTCVIPVLPRVKAILNKYNFILPKKRYDYYLSMLDVVGSTINLPFKLTTHIGRKTAGVWLLNEGVSIEVVSKVLGHKSVTTTENTYTRILNKRIDKEFEHLY